MIKVYIVTSFAVDMIHSVAFSGNLEVASGVMAGFAASGTEVIVYVPDSKSAESVRKRAPGLAENMESERGISFTSEIGDLRHADMIIDLNESDESSLRFLEEVERVVGEDCIILISPVRNRTSKLYGRCIHPERFAGITLTDISGSTPLAEVISLGRTSTRTVSSAKEAFADAGAAVVVVHSEIPFSVPEVILHGYLEGVASIMDAGWSIKDVDTMVRYRFNTPILPSSILSYSGSRKITFSFEQNAGYAGSRKLSERLEAHSEHESRSHSAGNIPESADDIIAYMMNPVDILKGVLVSCIRVLSTGNASIEEIGKAVSACTGWAEGIFEICDMIGLESMAAFLKDTECIDSDCKLALDMLENLITKGKSGTLNGQGFLAWEAEFDNLGPVNYTSAGHTAYITMKREEKLNALNEEMWAGLLKSFKRAEEDDDVKQVVLQGSSNAFSAGDDISMMAGWNGTDAETWMATYADPLVKLLLHYSKPVIAAVKGIAAGGGCELLMLCDIVISSENAVFSIPEGRIGAMPPIASSLGYGVISRRLLRYALTGEQFSAKTAWMLGLADILVDSSQIGFTVYEIIKKLGTVSSVSHNSVKKVSNQVKDIMAEAIDSGKKELVRLSGTDEFKEGQKAFINRRKQNWRNK